jgi:hypothetical protein
MRTLAADDQARSLRPGGEREVVRQLATHAPSRGWLSPSIAGRHAASGSARRLAHALVDRVAEGEPDGNLAARVGQRVAGAGRVRAR